ncbi:MAG: prepilin-type N-terminal cleavage/methylation domain-containing protein [Sedimentisphaerales bacterium]|nr:prepilin-type N-terminal cleavage/methylation domain-containing protein [Sedimentisphaerales bacterium]
MVNKAGVPAFGRGFSLLELLLVLTMIATLTAMAVPRYQTSLARYRADLAAQRIVADLTQARTSAKTASASRTVTFSVEGNSYDIPQLSSLNGNSGCYIVALSERPYQVRLISVNFGGDTEIMYNGWGLPDSGGTVILAIGIEQRTVTVDSETGRAEVQ